MVVSAEKQYIDFASVQCPFRSISDDDKDIILGTITINLC